MKFSPTTLCFYPPEIEYPSLPDDLIDVLQSDYEAAMARQPNEILSVVNGVLVIIPAPVPTSDDLLAQATVTMTVAVQTHMDAEARSKGYDSLLSVISYAEEPAVPAFQADGQAFRAWRSLVWAQCHALLAQVRAGELPIPTQAELLALLPELAL